ncbi:MAG: hypothetical protein WBE63_14920, partial [Acidobacteriaceae bacterium]
MSSEILLTATGETPTIGRTMRSIGLSLATIFMSAVLLPSPARAQAPVFEVTPQSSKIKFHVESSMDLTGNFDNWKA